MERYVQNFNVSLSLEVTSLQLDRSQCFLPAVSFDDFTTIANGSSTTWFSKKFFKLTEFVLV